MIVYDIRELEHLEKRMKQLIKKKQLLLLKHSNDKANPEQINIEGNIIELQQEIHSIENTIAFKPNKFSGTAFVSFETEEGTNYIFNVLLVREINCKIKKRRGF